MSEAPSAGDAGIRPNTLICIDGRTCGNPARLVAAGGPGPNGVSTSEKRQDFLARHDRPARSEADARNAVCCGDKAIDRSPCGTGTSARMAQLHAKGRLKTCDPCAQGFQVV